MSWARPQYRSDGRPRRPFLRRLKYETVKEGGGTLLQHVGTGLGAVIGLVAARWGIPQTASVIVGAIVGSTVGAIGKGFVTAAADHQQERDEGNGGDGASAPQSGQLVAPAVAGPLSGVIGLAADLNAVVKRMTDAYAQLGRLLNEMRTSHDTLMLVLYGARPDVLTRISAQSAAARGRAEDAQELLRFAGGDVRAYLMSR